MNAPHRIPPAPVGQQAPPARAAASDLRPRRGTRGSLPLTTGTGCRCDPTRPAASSHPDCRAITPLAPPTTKQTNMLDGHPER
jgi:hypothetical protein